MKRVPPGWGQSQWQGLPLNAAQTKRSISVGKSKSSGWGQPDSESWLYPRLAVWSGQDFSIWVHLLTYKMGVVLTPTSCVRIQWDDTQHRPGCLYSEPCEESQPLDSASVLTPTVFFFSFSFSSMRIPLTFFLTCYRRDFLRVTHLYSCLRLTASVWSLPHFQVHVITFSAPDCFSAVAAFPKPLVSSARGRKQDTCSSPWSHSKRTREWPPLAASPLLSP